MCTVPRWLEGLNSDQLTGEAPYHYLLLCAALSNRQGHVQCCAIEMRHLDSVMADAFCANGVG